MKFIPTFLGSFHSPETYARVRAQDHAHGFAYSILLVMLVALCLTLFYIQMFHRAMFVPQPGRLPVVEDVVMQVARQVPVMTYKDGVLMTREPQAHHIAVTVDAFGAHEEGVLATIDTTGATTHRNMDTSLLFTAREMLVKKDGKVEIKPYTEMLDRGTLVINRALAMESGQRLVTFVKDRLLYIYLVCGVLVWCAYTLVMYVKRLLMLLVLAFGGWLIGAAVSQKVNYTMAMRMAAVSFTPVAVFDMLAVMVAQVTVPVWTLVLCGLITLSAALVASQETSLAPRV